VLPHRRARRTRRRPHFELSEILSPCRRRPERDVSCRLRDRTRIRIDQCRGEPSPAHCRPSPPRHGSASRRHGTSKATAAPLPNASITFAAFDGETATLDGDPTPRRRRRVRCERPESHRGAGTARRELVGRGRVRRSRGERDHSGVSTYDTVPASACGTAATSPGRFRGQLANNDGAQECITVDGNHVHHSGPDQRRKG
jgi:hypothetical protein